MFAGRGSTWYVGTECERRWFGVRSFGGGDGAGVRVAGWSYLFGE